VPAAGGRGFEMIAPRPAVVSGCGIPPHSAPDAMHQRRPTAAPQRFSVYPLLHSPSGATSGHCRFRDTATAALQPSGLPGPTTRGHGPLWLISPAAGPRSQLASKFRSHLSSSNATTPLLEQWRELVSPGAPGSCALMANVGMRGSAPSLSGAGRNARVAETQDPAVSRAAGRPKAAENEERTGLLRGRIPAWFQLRATACWVWQGASGHHLGSLFPGPCSLKPMPFLAIGVWAIATFAQLLEPCVAGAEAGQAKTAAPGRSASLPSVSSALCRPANAGNF